jgi:mono/diheme cytochrome c family protein
MRLLAIIGVLAILVVLAAAAYFLGGFYSVAGTQTEPEFVASTIFRIRTASIDRHATEMPSVSLDDPALVQAGALAYTERGCVNCHGGPGVKWAKFSEGLHPSPPDLKEIVNGLEPRQLFWVIRNGIDMTGMPSFGPVGVPDPEIWSIVAFLKRLPSVSDQDFKAWSAAAAPKTQP